MAKARKEDIPSWSPINYALARRNTKRELTNYYNKQQVDEMFASGAESATTEEINAIINGIYA